uniref:SECIS binding protein 2 n=1 Tax=Xenopus tropicalis TaxID=8364 RepID=A0A803J9A1_XENTR
MMFLLPGLVVMESAANPVTWVSKVKQPPKNVMLSSTSVSVPGGLTPTNKDMTHWAQRMPHMAVNIPAKAEPEHLVEKKKKKRKKKKTSPNSDVGTENSQHKNIVVQEPPKFQDDEEFPDLSAAVSGSGKGFRKSDSYVQGPRAEKAVNAKSTGKKSKALVQLDLGGMLAVLEGKQHTDKTKQNTKPLVLSVGSGAPVLAREPVPVLKQPKQGPAPHNPLDSSAPLVKKGKQREVPKAKKPTSLKKIILKEREERKQRLTSATQELTPQGSHILSDGAGPPVQSISPSEGDCLGPLETALAEIQEDSVEDLILGNSEISAIQPVTESTVSLPQQSTSNLPKIHSRRFREYCSQVLSKDVDNCVMELLKELVRFQDRLFLKEPAKAKSKRRLVMGLREVLKHLKLQKLKCIIISPNCEKIQSKGGLDDTLQTIISHACEQNVPFVFALNRKALGRCLNKAVPVSVVGVFSYDGAQDHFHKLCELTVQARQAYKDMIAAAQEQQSETEAGKNEEEPVAVNGQNKSDDMREESKAEEPDEPNYIKVWRKMLEEDYTPYALSLEGKVTTDMLNLQL